MRAREALALAQELSHPLSLCFALTLEGTVRLYRREALAAQEHCEAAITLANEHGLPFWVALGTFNRGWALAAQGRAEEGLEQIERGVAAYRAIGATLLWSHFLGRLAQVCGAAGQCEKGLQVLTEALAHVSDTGERPYESELYRFKGELILQQSQDTAEAGFCFQKALEGV